MAAMIVECGFSLIRQSYIIPSLAHGHTCVDGSASSYCHVIEFQLPTNVCPNSYPESEFVFLRGVLDLIAATKTDGSFCVVYTVARTHTALEVCGNTVDACGVSRGCDSRSIRPYS